MQGSTNNRLINFISILTTVVTIAAVSFNAFTDFNSFKNSEILTSVKKNSDILNIDTSYLSILRKIQELSIQSSNDTSTAKEAQLKMIDSINIFAIPSIDSIKKTENRPAEIEIGKMQPLSKEISFTTQKFWIKVIFSGIFCFAALYVILSKKYDDETKKWAFSVLTLIAGVWIGSL